MQIILSADGAQFQGPNQNFDNIFVTSSRGRRSYNITSFGLVLMNVTGFFVEQIFLRRKLVKLIHLIFSAAGRNVIFVTQNS